MDSNEIYTIMLDESDRYLYIGSSSIIGKRKEQQDAIKVDTFYSYIESGKAIAVLCDGMGGLTGGAKASALCSSIVYQTFHTNVKIDSIPVFYKSVISKADEEVSTIATDELGTGTTLASVIVNEDQLYWASVGDSRIYIVRGEEILCITKDHNFLMLLNEKVKRGEITQEEADHHAKKEALISYIGMGGIQYIDMSRKAFQLKDGDYIIICSDGLYRSISEEEMKRSVYQYGKDVQSAAEAMTELTMKKKKKNQDNASVIVLGYQDSG